MARLPQRIFALSIAVLFFAFASALSVFVVYDAIKSHKDQTALDTTQTPVKSLTGTPLGNFTPVNKVDTLQSIDLKMGTGTEAKAGQQVTVEYTGAVASTGLIFQTTQDTGQSVPVILKTGDGGVINGWAEGVPGMKVGGIRRLIIPAAKAYADHPPQGSGIPPNAALVFDVTLVKINS